MRNHHHNHYHPVSALPAHASTTISATAFATISHQHRRCPRNAPLSNRICISFLFFISFSLYPPERILFSVYLLSTLPYNLRDMRIPTFPSNDSNLPILLKTLLKAVIKWPLQKFHDYTILSCPSSSVNLLSVVLTVPTESKSYLYSFSPLLLILFCTLVMYNKRLPSRLRQEVRQYDDDG